MAAILDDARRAGFAVVKFHSHPTSYEQFSKLDDESDAECFAAISSWLDDDERHGSVVMLPDRRMFGRVSGVAWPGDDSVSYSKISAIL